MLMFYEFHSHRGNTHIGRIYAHHSTLQSCKLRVPLLAQREYHRYDRYGRRRSRCFRNMGEVLRSRQILPIRIFEGQDLPRCRNVTFCRFHDNLVS